MGPKKLLEPKATAFPQGLRIFDLKLPVDPRLALNSWDHSTLEAEAGISVAWAQPGLHSEFEESLDYI